MFEKPRFYKSIWREDIHEQKESCVAAVLRMEALNIYFRLFLGREDEKHEYRSIGKR